MGRARVGTHLPSLSKALSDDGLEACNLLLHHLHLLDADGAVLHEEVSCQSRNGAAVGLLARLEEGVVLAVVF